MKTQELEKLLTETGAPCVTIILPLHNVLPDKTKEPKSVTETKKTLKQKYSKTNSSVNNLIDKIDELVKQIEDTNAYEGVGIYVSANISKLIYFPFPVVEKVKIKNIFDCRDLLYYFNSMTEYYVLSISKKHIHLFTGTGEKLKEMKNEDFPIDYIESYEYEKPSKGTSFGSNMLKEYERDKSVVQEIRLVDFLKTADHNLKKYLNDNNNYLVVSGGRKEIADFMSITQFKKRVVGKVSGNYNFNGNSQLANLSKAQIASHLKKENKNSLNNIHELTGNKLVATGLKDVWKNAIDGKGLKLFVEKDFEKSGYISSDGHDLKLRKTISNKKYLYYNDVVEKIIKIVRSKKGEVIFSENNEMEDFGKIALQLRYSVNTP